MPRKRFPDEIKIRESAVAQDEAIRLVSFFNRCVLALYQTCENGLQRHLEYDVSLIQSAARQSQIAERKIALEDYKW